MAILETDQVSFSRLVDEYGGSSPVPLSDYYAGGGKTPAGQTGVLGAIPSSGLISLGHFRGTAGSLASGARFAQDTTYTIWDRSEFLFNASGRGEYSSLRSLNFGRIWSAKTDASIFSPVGQVYDGYTFQDIGGGGSTQALGGWHVNGRWYSYFTRRGRKPDGMTTASRDSLFITCSSDGGQTFENAMGGMMPFASGYQDQDRDDLSAGAHFTELKTFNIMGATRTFGLFEESVGSPYTSDLYRTEHLLEFEGALAPTRRHTLAVQGSASILQGYLSSASILEYLPDVPEAVALGGTGFVLFGYSTRKLYRSLTGSGGWTRIFINNPSTGVELEDRLLTRGGTVVKDGVLWIPLKQAAHGFHFMTTVDGINFTFVTANITAPAPIVITAPFRWSAAHGYGALAGTASGTRFIATTSDMSTWSVRYTNELTSNITSLKVVGNMWVANNTWYAPA